VSLGIASSLRSSIGKHPGRAVAVAVVLVGAGALALYWFAPWNLFIDKRVDEALPGVTAQPGATMPTVGATGGTDATGELEQPADDPVELALGEFASLEHATTGTALVLELVDGRRFLRLQDLETSNGPDLRVYLSSVPASDDWYVYDDEEFVDLGGLKGNLGSSNYAIPASVDLGDFETAVIWCRRFSVGFGVATLAPVR
jgi:Electron transfer DM13